MPEEITTPAGAEAAQGQQPEGQAAGSGEGSADAKEDIKSLPEWAQKKIGALNAEARDYRQNARKAQDEKKAADDKALADKEEWKTLAQQREAEITTLKAKAADYDTLNDFFTQFYRAEIEKWPDEVKAMQPDDSASAQVKTAWMEKARGVVAKMQGAPASTQAAPVPGGNRSGPKPTTQGQQMDTRTPVGENDAMDYRRKF